MTTFVVGASGATGKHVVNHLLNKGQKVKVVVLSPEKLPDSWKNNESVSVIRVPSFVECSLPGRQGWRRTLQTLNEKQSL